jgi:hypothetical protein
MKMKDMMNYWEPYGNIEEQKGKWELTRGNPLIF